MLCANTEFPRAIATCPSPVSEDMKERKVGNTGAGSVLGGFAIGLGVAGLYFALQLWILPAAGIPT